MGIKRIEQDFQDQTLSELDKSCDRILNVLLRMLPSDVSGFAVVMQMNSGLALSVRSDMEPDHLVSLANVIRDQLNDDTAVTLGK